MAGSVKKPRKIKPHKSKYSKNIIGKKDKKRLEDMLEELREVKELLLKSEYAALGKLNSNSSEYYKEVRRLYFRYIS